MKYNILDRDFYNFNKISFIIGIVTDACGIAPQTLRFEANCYGSCLQGHVEVSRDLSRWFRLDFKQEFDKVITNCNSRNYNNKTNNYCLEHKTLHYNETHSLIQIFVLLEQLKQPVAPGALSFLSCPSQDTNPITLDILTYSFILRLIP